ncbi:MAG: hypothetical protein P8Y71_27415 [Pseudolabrys sp.]
MPETFSNPVTCFMHGQAYIAGTALGRNLASDERVRVICRRKQAATLPDDTELADRRHPLR